MKTLASLARENPRLMFLTADLGFEMAEPFLADFPKQFLNVGVAEQNLMGVAAGLALEGRTVFAYSIGNFATLRCLEQIRNDVAYHGADVKIVAMGGGFSYGSQGSSHHATEDIAVMRAIPGMSVVVPADDWEAEEATRALARTPGPAYLRLDKMSAEEARRTNEIFALGKARPLREGNVMTLIAAGGVLRNVLGAADKLREAGLPCRVLSLHTISPLDIEAIVLASRQTGGIVTVEEHSHTGGLGAAVAQTCLEHDAVPKQFRSLALKGFSTTVGSQVYLQAKSGLDQAAIINAVRELHAST